MKILVCIDGSGESQKALEQAIVIAKGCGVHEVSIMHVYEISRFDTPPWGSHEGHHNTGRDMEHFKRIANQQVDRKEEMLKKAKGALREENLDAKTILKEGHPAETIIKTANEEGYDMVVMGSRGLGGLKKLVLGSVSNAVLQEVKASVLVVK